MKKIRNSRFPEFFALAVFIIAYVVITIFHEPWFDEAQAWQIAKCASLREILFEIPHYEGHPPLWHLILAIPAKLGVPYEIGLKTVGFLFSAALVSLILFRSPFPRVVRLLLPFNFFIFYQFGVIVRPYGMLLLFLLLLAMVFPERNEKPWLFSGALMLLCITHSYGILIAGGVAVCYLWDMIEEKGFSRFFRELFHDRRIWPMAALLVLALVIIAEIMPAEDTYVAPKNGTNSFIICLLCTVFSMIPECLCTSMAWTSVDTYVLQSVNIHAAELVALVFIGAVFWIIIFCCSSKRSFKYFAVPYLMFAIFGAAVYITAHHEGVALSILIFWLWITLSDDGRFEGWKKLCEKSNGFNTKFVSRTLTVLGLFCLLIPVYWSVSASVHEIQENYSFGRDAAQFLKSTGLDDTLVFKSWLSLNKTDKYEQVLFCSADSSVLAYFDHNIYANTNGGDPKKVYTVHKNFSKEDIERECSEWRKIGIPDVIVGLADIGEIFGDEITQSDYSPVYFAYSSNIYKNNIAKYYTPIYLRNDLLDEYDVEVKEMNLNRSFTVSGDMIASYLSGEKTLDELVDETFGSLELPG